MIVLRGRYAGRKGVVVKTFDDGAGDRKFGHALVVGIDRYPRKITRAMGKAKTAKRSKVKPFVKTINYSHLMPTRYMLDITDALTGALKGESGVSTDRESLTKARKDVKTILEERYQTQDKVAKSISTKDKTARAKAERYATGVNYFFKKLRF